MKKNILILVAVAVLSTSAFAQEAKQECRPHGNKHYWETVVPKKFPLRLMDLRNLKEVDTNLPLRLRGTSLVTLKEGVKCEVQVDMIRNKRGIGELSFDGSHAVGAKRETALAKELCSMVEGDYYWSRPDDCTLRICFSIKGREHHHLEAFLKKEQKQKEEFCFSMR